MMLQHKHNLLNYDEGRIYCRSAVLDCCFSFSQVDLINCQVSVYEECEDEDVKQSSLVSYSVYDKS